MANPFASAFQLSFQISPIILVGGLASSIPGGMLPIVALTEGLSLATGSLLSGSLPDSLDDFFAQFVPVSGGNIISNEFGTYPFANQNVAANAVIQQPLNISMMMICPARGGGGYLTKLATMSALQASIQTHILRGGTFIVATPSYIYPPCMLALITDVTGPDTKQVQARWQWDFINPLITLGQAQTAWNGLMNNINNGTQISGDPPSFSGLASAAGQPLSGATATLVPGAANLAGTTAPFISAVPSSVSAVPIGAP